ncbi:MAG: MBL fold metallo-hydrolase [Actinomycetota bacterium]|nr:MBL fold metallo-hydrolase [Actinomycetota bacterium]
MDELASGIWRLTLPLPVPPGHVHCYLLPGREGWTLVDTGLALPGVAELIERELASLDGPVARVVVTHFHPDHVGAAEPVRVLTGAPVYQGELDYAQCENEWGSEDWPRRLSAWFRRNGVPGRETEELREEDEQFRPLIRFAPSPELVRGGDRLDAWEVLELPGHADGHLCLLRDGVLVTGDHLLPEITPAIGLYPDQRPDPLGDYLASLEQTLVLAPRLALPAHGPPIADPPARVRAIVAHHQKRLDETAAALGPTPRSGHEVSRALFGDDLDPRRRRFAVAESLSHLERLVFTGAAEKGEDDGLISYTAARSFGRPSSK